MIVRIVKMKFRKEETGNFLKVFREAEPKIRNFRGCIGLQLFQLSGDSSTLFTYSLWDSEENLNHYRFSELFKTTWAKTKVLFEEPPQAWSLISTNYE